MKYLPVQKLLALALASFLIQPPLAQSTTTQTKPSSNLRAVSTPDATYFMNGNQVLARTTKKGFSVYIYEKGRLSKVAHSDGHFTKYHYEKGRLNRIIFSDGTVQKAVFGAGVLRSIESSSGQRLGLAPGAGRVDKVMSSSITNSALAVPGRSKQLLMDRSTPTERRTTLPLEKTTPADRVNTLNKQLIAIESWETNAWKCTVAPDGGTVCIGRPDPDERGGGGGMEPPYDPGLPPPEDLPGDEEGVGGGGGSGSEPVPPNLPTLESCLQAAYNTWIIMRDEICPMVSNQQVCLEANYKLFQELREQCKIEFP